MYFIICMYSFLWVLYIFKDLKLTLKLLLFHHNSGKKVDEIFSVQNQKKKLLFTLNTVYRVDNEGKYFPVSSTSYHHTLSFYHNLKRICYVSVTRKVHFWTFKISQNWKKFQFLKYLQIYLSLISIHFLILFICQSCVYHVYHLSIMCLSLQLVLPDD